MLVAIFPLWNAWGSQFIPDSIISGQPHTQRPKARTHATRYGMPEGMPSHESHPLHSRRDGGATLPNRLTLRRVVLELAV
jgi:hypothetical protein